MSLLAFRTRDLGVYAVCEVFRCECGALGWQGGYDVGDCRSLLVRLSGCAEGNEDGEAESARVRQRSLRRKVRQTIEIILKIPNGLLYV